jgi:hypothetical protein
MFDRKALGPLLSIVKGKMCGGQWRKSPPRSGDQALRSGKVQLKTLRAKADRKMKKGAICSICDQWP